ncbi:MAG TPA: cadherin domain-containing protein, partial [Luteolibacter sp.]
VVDESTGNDRNIYLNNGNIFARVYNNETISSTGQNYGDGQWHHVIHTFGGGIGGQKLYVDGEQVASGTKTSSAFNVQTAVKIGYSVDSPAPYFNGEIDDVRIHYAGLAVADAVAMYNSGLNNAPKMASASFTVAENCANGTTVGTVLATDSDAGQTLAYSIVGGNVGNRFAINSSSGVITATGGLNHELIDSFMLTVRAIDNGSPGASCDATVVIGITDVNDAPAFASNPLMAVAAAPGIAYAGSLAATDDDPGDTIAYSKQSGPVWLTVGSDGSFGGTPATGNIGVNDFAVRATDNHGLYTDVILRVDVANLSITPIWGNAAGGSWPVAGNWLGGSVGNGSSMFPDFSTLNLTANATVTLDGARTIGGLKFGDNLPSHAWTLNTGTGGPLTLAVASGTPTVTVNNQTTTINAVIAGNQGLAKTGAGTLTLNGANTYTGTTTVNAGTLTLGASSVLASPSVTVATGATLQLGNNAGQNAVSAFTINGTITTAGQASIFANFTLNNGTINATAGGGAYGSFYFASARTITANGSSNVISTTAGNGLGLGGTLTFATPLSTDALLISGNLGNANAISKQGGFIKTGLGTVTLSNTNTYIGATAINNGTLLVNGSLSTTATTVAASGKLGGSGTLGGAVTNNGTLAPGNGSIGTLSVNNTVTLAPGSAIAWEIADWTGSAGTDWDRLTVNSLNLTATSANPVVIRLSDPALVHFSDLSTSFVLVQTTG